MDDWDAAFLKRSPMFEPLSLYAQRFEHRLDWPDLDDYQTIIDAAKNSLLTANGAALKVVPQAPKSNVFNERYEPRIYLRGELQARSRDWHDLFNVLVWVTFPHSKAALNQRHYQAALPRSTNPHRTQNRSRIEDTLTLLDEGGVIVASSDEKFFQMLRDRQWKDLFWHHRAEVLAKMNVFLFGHALYQKALEPYVGVSGKAICVLVEEAFFSCTLEQKLATVDVKASALLRDQHSFNSPSDFPAFPLLGMPGWTEDNRFEQFYDNTHYFRAKPNLANSVV